MGFSAGCREVKIFATFSETRNHPARLLKQNIIYTERRLEPFAMSEKVLVWGRLLHNHVSIGRYAEIGDHSLLFAQVASVIIVKSVCEIVSARCCYW